MSHDCPVCGQAIGDLPLTIYRERSMVIARGMAVFLTSTECDLLSALANVFPRVLTKEAAMAAIYGLRSDGGPEIKIIDVFICKLRAKVAPIGVVIDTFLGQGYALRVERKPVVIEVAV